MWFVLIHSPVVGPATWMAVARELERRGHAAVVPSLLGVADAPVPQWRHCLEAVRAAAEHLTEPLVLVAHSGAGLLLPEIARALTAETAAMIFDSGITDVPKLSTITETGWATPIAYASCTSQRRASPAATMFFATQRAA